MHRLPLIVTVVVSVVVIAGCGGGGGGATSTPEAPTSISVIPTQPPRIPQELTAVATKFGLEAYRHDAQSRTQGTDLIDFPYDISLPQGWTVENTGIAVTASLPGVNNFPLVTISIDCRPSMDKSTMLDKDSQSAAKLSLGNLSDAARSQTTVGGRDAIRVDWSGGSGFPARHISVYVNGKDCAWRLQLNTFGSLAPDEFEPLFQRVLDSFNPAQGL